ncbi:SGNH/GDSL hydrolase family protein [Streptomyces sp. NPDC056549]|uniref:SGNH/GDSL hydrolase family protein n=1 Tax=Streptomyces sp. NPDC056549 TaxID=3345864 RepID=UPI0036C6CE7C
MGEHVTRRRTVRIGWFGTSIMEHLQAHVAAMADQTRLPPVGSTVTVERWQQRGYPHFVALALQADHPGTLFEHDNRSQGGATIRDMHRIVNDTVKSSRAPYDVAVLGCGINDVWRAHQVGREAEGVGPEEYADLYMRTLHVLVSVSKEVLCIGETAVRAGAVNPGAVSEVNNMLARYNAIAAAAAATAGACYLDVQQAFQYGAENLPPGLSLWTDGVHLSELGATLLARQVHPQLARLVGVHSQPAQPVPARKIDG